MAKLNSPATRVPTVKTPRGTGPMATKSKARTVTHEGATGYVAKDKTALFLLAASSLAGEDSFYESANDRNKRFRELVRTVTLKDPDWVAQFIPYLRGEMNMRTASVIMAIEWALARREAKTPVPSAFSTRQVIVSALQRADEPGEAVAYWRQRTGGKSLPGGVQRGLADAVVRLTNEYSAMKYDSAARAYRLGDVVELTRPKPKGDAQDALFRYLLDTRHRGSDARLELDKLPMIAARKALNEIPQGQRRKKLTEPGFADTLRVAGATWEDMTSWLGGALDASFWEAVIPNMGYMALLRNLRNFDEAGIKPTIARAVADKLRDPEQVRGSRQLPYRFLSAYLAAPSLHWGAALEEALDVSLENVPEFEGRTLVLADSSGSMSRPMSLKSKVTYEQVAALFALALAKRSPGVDVVMFASTSMSFAFRKGGSVLSEMQRWSDENGKVGYATGTATAIRKHYAGQDRVVVISDEQAHGDIRGDVSSAVPANVPLHTFSLGGYAAHHAPTTANRFLWGGLTDRTFKLMQLVEAGQDANWPWEQA